MPPTAGPCQTGHKADLVAHGIGLRQVLAHAEEGLEIAAGDGDALGRLGGDEAHGAFAAQRGQLPLEITHAGLAGIARDDLADGVVGDAHLRALHAVLLELLGQQMLLGDLQLFLIRV